MKAAIYTRYGSPDVVEIKDVPTPVPGDDQVLLEVHAASLNSYDYHLLTADPFLVRMMGGGLLHPANSRIGADVAGRVVSVGRNVSRLRPGDRVYGDLAAAGAGSCAEFAVAPESALAPMASNLSFEQAAAVPMAAVTALQGWRDVGRIQPGHKVLIHGAAGGVGTFAVQLARYFGAEVTAVCSTSNAEQTRALGAEHVIDYTREDFTRNGQLYDLIMGVNGYRPLREYVRALVPGGMYLMAGGKNPQIFEALLLPPFIRKPGGRKVRMVSARPSREDLIFLNGLLESGQLKPVIDRRFSLAEIRDALRYLGTGHARAKIVISVRGNGAAPAGPAGG